MAVPLNTCTKIEQRGVVVRFLWAKNMDAAKDIHKVMLPIWVAFICGYPLLHPYFLPT
jgi:membrane protease subunit (stomatin/prohibitin family)